MEYQCTNCGHVTETKGTPLQSVVEIPTRVDCCDNPEYKIADTLIEADNQTV